jgi:ABC-2 type transport system ATP-binding protein
VDLATDPPGSPVSPGSPAARPGSAPQAPPPATAAVVCEDLVVRYGDTLAVNRLSFTAHAGEIVALLGPNGAGKTSTVETLEGYRRPATGTVRVLGLDPHKDHADLVRHMGVMLQRGGIYPMLGSAQVLDLFARYYDDPEDPERLLDLVGLQAVRKTPWRRLSGGEQQRLSLALALVGRPSVVFLDEPTAGVDPEGRLAVRSVIAGLKESGISVILTTHELTEAERLADRVVIIDHGRKLAEDTPARLAARSADGSIRFTADPGIDAAALAAAVGEEATVDEERPGAYRLRLGAHASAPEAVAAVARWLAERDLTLTDLRTGSSLEEAYLAITGSSGTVEPAPRPEAGAAGRRGRRTGRRAREAKPPEASDPPAGSGR